MTSDPAASADAGERFMPALGSETGFAVEEAVSPIRPSGIFTLVLGLTCVICGLSKALLFLPLSTFVLGLFAIRPYEGPRPIGMTVAKVGMISAMFFGIGGYMIHVFKERTLSAQARVLSREFIEVVADGELEIAMEMMKTFNNRYPATMPLKTFYELNERAKEGLDASREDRAFRKIRARGTGQEWALMRPIRIYRERGRQEAQAIWIDPSGDFENEIEIVMEMKHNPETDVYEWHVARCQNYVELLVAESIL